MGTVLKLLEFSNKHELKNIRCFGSTPTQNQCISERVVFINGKGSISFIEE